MLALTTAAFAQAPVSTSKAVAITPNFEKIKDLARTSKGEFETTKEYARRKCTALSEILGGSPDSILRLALEKPRIHYDADRQRFVVESIAGAPSRDAMDEKRYYLPILSRIKDSASYVASNNFGVKRDVTVRNAEHLVVSIAARTYLQVHLHLELAAKPAEAATLKNDIGLEITARFSAPCVTHKSDRTDPSLQTPIEERSDTYALHAAPDATWRLVRVSSGSVLKSGRL